jgi:hypothetical protein
MIFNGGNVKKEVLQTIMLRWETRGEVIFENVYTSLQRMNVPIHEHMSINKDGPLAVNNENPGITGLCKKYSAFPDF